MKDECANRGEMLRKRPTAEPSRGVSDTTENYRYFNAHKEKSKRRLPTFSTFLPLPLRPVLPQARPRRNDQNHVEEDDEEENKCPCRPKPHQSMPQPLRAFSHTPQPCSPYSVSFLRVWEFFVQSCISVSFSRTPASKMIALTFQPAHPTPSLSLNTKAPLSRIRGKDLGS